MAYIAAITLISMYGIVFLGQFEHVNVGGVDYLHVADDHMITQRVARNFHLTGTPYFNPGEAVAANTSLFWPMLLSGLYLVLSPNAVMIVLIASSALATGLAIALASTLAPGRACAGIVAVALILSPAVLNYGASGWEHIPQLLSVTIAMVLIHNRSSAEQLHIPYGALWLFAAGFMFRPDGAIAVAVAVLVWMANQRRYTRLRSYFLAALLLPVPALYLALMQHYYGALVPNTAYLKILPLGERLQLGAWYLLDPRQSGLLPGCLLLLALLRPKTAFARFTLGLGAAQMVYVLYVGGDVFADGRFFLMLWPVVLAVTVQELWLGSRPGEGIVMVFAACTIALLLSHGPSRLRDAITYDQQRSSAMVQQIRLADAITRSMAPEDGSIGMHWLGVAYHMPQFHVVDFLGKSEPFIAKSAPKAGPIGHNKWDYAYAFDTYDIAAIPMRARHVAGALPEGQEIPPRDFMFWDVAVREIRARGNYLFVPPEVFGNPTGGFGLYLRRDIAARFGAFQGRQ